MGLCNALVTKRGGITKGMGEGQVWRKMKVTESEDISPM